jgi:hypothetical protein
MKSRSPSQCKLIFTVLGRRPAGSDHCKPFVIVKQMVLDGITKRKDHQSGVKQTSKLDSVRIQRNAVLIYGTESICNCSYMWELLF